MSGWLYRAAYKERPEEVLAELQECEFADDEFYWTDNVPQPASLDALVKFKESQRFWEFGTASILDMDRLVEAGEEGEEDHDGAIRLLTNAEVRQYLGSDRPTAPDFESAIDGPLFDYWM